MFDLQQGYRSNNMLQYEKALHPVLLKLQWNISNGFRYSLNQSAEPACE